LHELWPKDASAGPSDCDTNHAAHVATRRKVFAIAIGTLGVAIRFVGQLAELDE